MSTSPQDIPPPDDRTAPEHEIADAPNLPDATSVAGTTASLSDVPPSNDQTQDEVANVPEQPEAPSLGVAYAILRALHGDRIPDGPLGPETVPAAALDLPIAIAIEDLVHHLKRCQNPRCSHVPQPLSAYRKMRPNAIRNAKEQVYKVLWTHPNDELVV